MIQCFAFENGRAHVRQHFPPVHSSGPGLSFSFCSSVISFMQVTHHLFQQMGSTEMFHQLVEPAGRLWVARLCRHNQVVLILGNVRGAIRPHRLFLTSLTSCSMRLPATVTVKMRFLLPPLSVSLLPFAKRPALCFPVVAALRAPPPW